jgi:type IV pilus assembly protein PilY1
MMLLTKIGTATDAKTNGFAGTTQRLALACALSLACLILGHTEVRAQSMADYTAYPPFVGANAVPPNVLLIMDNSGSMNEAAYNGQAFDPARAYGGLFDATECYSYGSNRFSPDPAGNPATPGTCTDASYPWSGNLLNYVGMRRVDIVKWVMIGGVCFGPRDVAGNCATGSEVRAQDNFDSGACCLNQTMSVSTSLASGRIPASIIPSGSTVYFHTMGSVAALKGSVCVDDDSTQQTSSDCNDGGTYTESLWRLRIVVTALQGGVVQEVGNKVRFGLMEFNTSQGGKVLSDVGGNIVSMVNAIDVTVPSTWTPLAESLYEGTRYYAQIAPAYSSSDYSYTITNRDPYYFVQPQWAGRSQYVPCCKSFAILFTDGEPTQDQNIPAALQDYGHAIHGGHCTASPSSDPCTPHKTNYPNSGSHYLDDVAYYAHTTDLRQATMPVLNVAGKDLSGFQNLTIYTFYAFGQPIGREVLQAAAKSGGFVDRNNNNVPDLPEEWDRLNNYTGAEGADGLPDTYYESEDADKLKDRLLAAITSILQRSASGTSLSVLANSSTGEGALYQAFFYPLTMEGFSEIRWAGYTQGLFLDAFGNLREDTDADGRLVLQNDHIIKTRYDTALNEVKVDRYADANADGKADTSTPFLTVGLKEVKGIWEAGKQLALTASSARNIQTWVDTDNDGVVDAGEQIPFTTANSATLAPYLRAAAAPFTADNIINFIRGDQVSGMRDRQITVGAGLQVWKLGDPTHSTPTVVGAPKDRYDLIYGDASYTSFFQQYRTRRQVAYMGANDGMLHAFNVGFYHRGDDTATTLEVEHGWFTRTPTDNSSGPVLGQELWGFIPNQLLPQLQWLTRTDYGHAYYVDLKPKVVDARIFTPDTDHPNGWGTVLIGGFRMGGSCGACTAGTGAPPMTVTADFGSGVQTRTFYSAYFAVDITNPDQNPKLLWVFTDPTLGLATSYPAVLRVNPSADPKTANTNAKWLMTVGSGPTAYNGSSVQPGKIFAFNLATGPDVGNSLVSTFSTSDANAFMGDLISLDADLDFRVDASYLGNVINNGGSPAWAGKLYRLTTGGGSPDLTMWGISSGADRVPTALLTSFPSSGSTKVGPIAAAPTVTMDESSKLWVFFGTGRFYSTVDIGNTDTQYFIGVKDPVMTGVCVQATVTNCERPNLLDVSAATVCVVCTGDQVTGVTGVTSLLGSSPSTLQGMVQSMDGWVTALPALRERALVSPTLLGGIIFFTTFVPIDDLCAASGSGNLYALFYLTGSAYKEAVIGTSASGSDTIVNRSIGLGTAGMASSMAVHVGGQGTGGPGAGSGSGCTGRVTGFIQSSTGTLSQFCVNPAQAMWSRYLSWVSLRE